MSWAGTTLNYFLGIEMLGLWKRVLADIILDYLFQVWKLQDHGNVLWADITLDYFSQAWRWQDHGKVVGLVLFWTICKRYGDGRTMKTCFSSYDSGLFVLGLESVGPWERG